MATTVLPPAAANAPTAPATATLTSTATATATALPTAARPDLAPAPAPAPAVAGRATAEAQDEPDAAPDPAPPGRAGQAIEPSPGTGQGAQRIHGAEASRSAGAAAASEGEPPPVYPTRLPPPARLSYLLRYNGREGQAQLLWQREATGPKADAEREPAAGPAATPAATPAPRYSLHLDGRDTAGAPLVEMDSRGGFDAAGLAPQRFIDRRRGKAWRAAHFRRDIGRISFSGPLVDYPAWPGAQDRLSWIAQLAAVAAAAPAPLRTVSFFVADARGRAEGWTLRSQGLETVATPLGEVAALHLLHEPERADGLRVQAWLDARRGHWPVRVRYTALRSGDVFELLLAAEPRPE